MDNPLNFGIGSVVGFILAVVLIKTVDYLRLKDADKRAKEIIEQAEREISSRRREAELENKEAAIQQRSDGERELSKIRDELHERQRVVDKREDSLDQKTEQLGKQEAMVANNQLRLAERIEEADRHNQELALITEAQQKKLHELSGLSKEAATGQLLTMLDEQLKHETGARILEHEKQLTETCEEKSREILVTSLQRYAATHVANTTTNTVDIPSDEMKGRIIGREGRNIRAFEKATGCDVIIDDTPGVVIVSGFDMVRREVARRALEKLIADGRIHPARIEEIVEETQAEQDVYLKKIAQEAVQEVDISGLHAKTTELLGRLRFRTSYSQNVLRHSIEVAFLSGMMAEEVGLDGDLARRCGLLHDIGKAADHEAEGGHPKIGADLLKRYGEGPEVVHAALGHHDDIRIDYPYTVLVAAADACSAGRPGARRENLDHYIKRMEELESIANSFSGVTQAFAIRAGRELRILVSAKDTTDESAARVCRDIAKAYEEQLTYPGEIKVTVLRETRITEIAK